MGGASYVTTVAMASGSELTVVSFCIVPVIHEVGILTGTILDQGTARALCVCVCACDKGYPTEAVRKRLSRIFKAMAKLPTLLLMPGELQSRDSDHGMH